MATENLALDRATVRFGKQLALREFSGTFAPGTITALIGGDGAGKSTLLRLLSGRLALHSGTSHGMPTSRGHIGYQPADSGVWRNLSVAENIEFVGRVYGLTATQTQARADELLKRAGLDDVVDRLAGKLSGGMRQKLGVVLATLHQPDLVLLDEPTTGVDPISRAELWSLIAATAANGATVVFATTYLDEAERATALFLLGEGNLLASGTPDDVIAHTPGRVWQAPVSLAKARNELASRNVWRRGNTIYRWEESPEGKAPRGFEPAPGDLENTSIALLLNENSYPGANHTDKSGKRGRSRQETFAEVNDALDTGFTSSINGEGSEGEGSESDTSTALRERDTQNKRDDRGALLVRAEDVTRTYGSFTALDGVSLEVGPGEVVGLLGGNGAGKTTLMRILLGLETPTEGSATLFGAQPSLDNRRRIGYVAQGLGLYPALSAIENLKFAASVYGVPVNERAQKFALRFGRVPIASLPLGTKRILAYLAASNHLPELLVLDEPTSGMDALTRARLWRDLRAQADRGMGVLVTTHYMQEAAQCDRLVILSSGKFTAAGTVSAITAGHTSLIVRAEDWEKAFTLLQDAGIPAILDGRTLRLPGADPDEIRAVIAPLADRTTVTEGVATLEETMLLAGRKKTIE
ncbi:ATP-binding cassette domain-containing protein [Actinomycetaceae bacterium L2_0104]